MPSKKTIILCICAAALMAGALWTVAMQYGKPVVSAIAEDREAHPQGRHGDTPAQHDHKPLQDEDHEAHHGHKAEKGHGKHAAEEPSSPHDKHEGHEDDDEAHPVRLSEAEQREFSIQLGTAGPGPVQIHITLPGEVGLNADRLAHVVPRIPGIARHVYKTLGDHVREGEVMAVLDSRELAALQSAYLAAKERVTLAEVTCRRETDLWQKKITSEQEYLDAKQTLAEANITLRAAEQTLHAIGFSKSYLARLSTQPDTTLTRYTLTAPLGGTIVEKHITLGEVLKEDTNAFVVADLDSVWIDLKVYRKDLPFVRTGQPVEISAGPGIADAQGKIAYVGPVVGEQTRTALARIVLPNADGRWRPGLFVTGKIGIKDVEVPVRIPTTALQTIDDQSVVFVDTEAGFIPQAVTLGRMNHTYVEVTEGLQAGQRYVAQGAFTLKAQLAKGSFGDGHNH
jgi:cobalt-zinc-cadmium efflux system membrane fusion protein